MADFSKVKDQGADLLQVKADLDDAIMNASFRIDKLEDRQFTSRSRGGLFGGSPAYTEESTHESVHVDDFDFRSHQGF